MSRSIGAMGAMMAAALMAAPALIVRDEPRIGPGVRRTGSGTMIKTPTPERREKSDSLKRMLKSKGRK